MIARLEMTSDQWEQMRAHVRGCQPLEGCGLLLGLGAAVHRVVPIANAAQSPSRFRMEPAGQLRAFREMENQGLELLGVFHSHPLSAGDRTAVMEGPSETDVREAAYPAVQVIWSQSSGMWRALGFWIEDGQIQKVALDIDGAE